MEHAQEQDYPCHDENAKQEFPPKAVEKVAHKLAVNGILEEQDTDGDKEIDDGEYPPHIRRVAEPYQCAVASGTEHEQFRRAPQEATHVEQRMYARAHPYEGKDGKQQYGKRRIMAEPGKASLGVGCPGRCQRGGKRLEVLPAHVAHAAVVQGDLRPIALARRHLYKLAIVQRPDFSAARRIAHIERGTYVYLIHPGVDGGKGGSRKQDCRQQEYESFHDSTKGLSGEERRKHPKTTAHKAIQPKL